MSFRIPAVFLFLNFLYIMPADLCLSKLNFRNALWIIVIFLSWSRDFVSSILTSIMFQMSLRSMTLLLSFNYLRNSWDFWSICFLIWRIDYFHFFSRWNLRRPNHPRTYLCIIIAMNFSNLLLHFKSINHLLTYL